MGCGKVEICGVDTSTLPVLTNERMRELFPLVHGGDKAARVLTQMLDNLRDFKSCRP